MRSNVGLILVRKCFNSFILYIIDIDRESRKTSCPSMLIFQKMKAGDNGIWSELTYYLKKKKRRLNLKIFARSQSSHYLFETESAEELPVVLRRVNRPI